MKHILGSNELYPHGLVVAAPDQAKEPAKKKLKTSKSKKKVNKRASFKRSKTRKAREPEPEQELDEEEFVEPAEVWEKK